MIAITADQMRLVDDLAVNKYNILLEEMMELAGYHLTELAHTIMKKSLKNKKIVVLAGKGNNGGGGLVAARHLHNRGADVHIGLPVNKGLKAAVAGRLKTLKELQLPILYFEGENDSCKLINGAHLIIDALIGYGLKSHPEYPLSQLIDNVNDSGSTVLSLDVPTGIDSTKGNIYNKCVRADHTLTLALPKEGLLKENARNHIGSLYLADIGIPGALYKELGLDIENIFQNENIIKLTGNRSNL